MPNVWSKKQSLAPSESEVDLEKPQGYFQEVFGLLRGQLWALEN
jgi:hypothetical protein